MIAGCNICPADIFLGAAVSEFEYLVQDTSDRFGPGATSRQYRFLLDTGFEVLWFETIWISAEGKFEARDSRYDMTSRYGRAYQKLWNQEEIDEFLHEFRPFLNQTIQDCTICNPRVLRLTLQSGAQFELQAHPKRHSGLIVRGGVQANQTQQTWIPIWNWDRPMIGVDRPV